MERTLTRQSTAARFAGAVAFAVVALPSIEGGEFTWRALAAPNGNLFGTWEWASAWWSVYGVGRQLRLYAAGPRGAPPRAILPLYQPSKRPVPVTRFIGHGPADMLGPVCDPADRVATAEALKRL